MTFRSRHETITDAIWSYQIESEGYDIDEGRSTSLSPI